MMRGDLASAFARWMRRKLALDNGEEALRRFRKRLVLLVVDADGAADRAEFERRQRNEPVEFAEQPIRHERHAFAGLEQREAQLEMAHLPDAREPVAPALATPALRRL